MHTSSSSAQADAVGPRKWRPLHRTPYLRMGSDATHLPHTTAWAQKQIYIFYRWHCNYTDWATSASHSLLGCIDTIAQHRLAVCGDASFATSSLLSTVLDQRWVCKLYSVDTRCFTMSIRMKNRAWVVPTTPEPADYRTNSHVWVKGKTVNLPLCLIN
jgi:hypothetical protein